MTHDAELHRPGQRADLGRPWRFAGFWIENLSFPGSGSRPGVPYTDIVVPLYALVLASLVGPIMWLLKTIRRRKRLVCPHCGHNVYGATKGGAKSGEPSAVRLAA